MRRIVFVLVAVVALAGVVASMAPTSGQADGEAAPIFGVKIPPGYRDWRLISVAHEEGNLNDLRAILGNDVAIKAVGEGKLPFPDGTIIARLARCAIMARRLQRLARLVAVRASAEPTLGKERLPCRSTTRATSASATRRLAPASRCW